MFLPAYICVALLKFGPNLNILWFEETGSKVGHSRIVAIESFLSQPSGGNQIIPNENDEERKEDKGGDGPNEVGRCNWRDRNRQENHLEAREQPTERAFRWFVNFVPPESMDRE